MDDDNDNYLSRRFSSKYPKVDKQINDAVKINYFIKDNLLDQSELDFATASRLLHENVDLLLEHFVLKTGPAGVNAMYDPVENLTTINSASKNPIALLSVTTLYKNFNRQEDLIYRRKSDKRESIFVMHLSIQPVVGDAAFNYDIHSNL